jgi:hypothetical protein
MGSNADSTTGDRSYLVLAKPNVIMNDKRLRGLAVSATEAAGRKIPPNHAQTVRNVSGLLEMRRLLPASSKPKGWTANRQPR